MLWGWFGPTLAVLNLTLVGLGLGFGSEILALKPIQIFIAKQLIVQFLSFGKSLWGEFGVGIGWFRGLNFGIVTFSRGLWFGFGGLIWERIEVGRGARTLLFAFIGTSQPTQPPSFTVPQPSSSSLQLVPLSPPPPSYNLQYLSEAARFPPTSLQLQSPCVRVLFSFHHNFDVHSAVHFWESRFPSHARLNLFG